MKLRVTRRRTFTRDALRIFSDIGEDNMDAARRFLTSVNADLHTLAEMPGMGARRSFSDARFTGIRSWPVSGFAKYLIFYKFDDEALDAIRVIHGARDIERALTE